MTVDIAIRAAAVAGRVVQYDRFCGSYGARLTTVVVGVRLAVIPGAAQDATVVAQAAAVVKWPFPWVRCLPSLAIVVLRTPQQTFTRLRHQP